MIVTSVSVSSYMLCLVDSVSHVLTVSSTPLIPRILSLPHLVGNFSTEQGCKRYRVPGREGAGSLVLLKCHSVQDIQIFVSLEVPVTLVPVLVRVSIAVKRHTTMATLRKEIISLWWLAYSTEVQSVTITAGSMAVGRLTWC